MRLRLWLVPALVLLWGPGGLETLGRPPRRLRYGKGQGGTTAAAGGGVRERPLLRGGGRGARSPLPRSIGGVRGVGRDHFPGAGGVVGRDHLLGAGGVVGRDHCRGAGVGEGLPATER